MPKIPSNTCLIWSPVAIISGGSGGGVTVVELDKLRAEGVGEASICCNNCLSLCILSKAQSNISM